MRIDNIPNWVWIRYTPNHWWWFSNYTVQSGRPFPSNNKSTTERFSISTQSLDYVIGTFRLPNYNTIGQPFNTILSTQDLLEEGLTRATADEQVNAGLRRVYNQSKYFAHNGASIVTTTSKWRIGNNSYDPQNLDEQYNSLLVQHLILIKTQCLEYILA